MAREVERRGASDAGEIDQMVSAAYGALSDRYIELFGSVDRVHPDDLALFARYFEPGRGLVVDAGCGPGHLTAYLSSLGIDVRGIDLVSEFIAHARATYPQVRFDAGSLRSLPVPDGSLAGILAWYSLIHLDPADVPTVLLEFHRALEPGGSLVLGVVDGEKAEPFEHKVTTAHFWPVNAVAALLVRCGFNVEVIETRTDPGVRPHAALAGRKLRSLGSVGGPR